MSVFAAASSSALRGRTAAFGTENSAPSQTKTSARCEIKCALGLGHAADRGEEATAYEVGLAAGEAIRCHGDIVGASWVVAVRTGTQQ